MKRIHYIESMAEFVDLVAKNNKIYIYGAGKFAEFIYQILVERKLEVEGFFVSSLSGEQKIHGYDVRKFSIEQVKDNSIIILALSHIYLRDIVPNLLEKSDLEIVMIENIDSLYRELPKPINKVPKLEITATMGCKINCKYCPQKDLLHSYYKENKNRCSQMKLEDYKACINKMPIETIITFSGFVEPFLHPHAVEMMEYAHQRGHYIELFTTLEGMSLEDLERIKNIPFINVVLHTPDIYNYAKITVNEQYWEVLDKMLDLKKLNGRSFIDEANCQSEPTKEFIKFASERIEVKSELIDRAGNLNDVNLKSIQNVNGKIYCARSTKQNHWVLLPDGSVSLCCMDFGLKHIMGNLLKQSYEDILKNHEYLKIRKAMITEDNSILCRSCTAARKFELHPENIRNEYRNFNNNSNI